MSPTAFIIPHLKRSTIALVVILMTLAPSICPVRAESPQRSRGSSLSDGAVNPRSEIVEESVRTPAFSTEEPRLGAIQQTRLIASDAQIQAEFGWSAAISGNTAVVGARNADPDLGSGPLANAGAAYIFVRSGSTWIQEAKLVARNAEPGDTFGISVAIDGNTVVVGATGVDTDEDEDVGAAYVFVRDGVTWAQKAKLVSKDASADANFGSSVAIEGITIVVGADGHDLGGVLIDSGAAYVFIRRSGAWDQKAKLVPINVSAGDYFGTSTAISGNRIVVGATEANLTGSSGNGSAYVFAGSGHRWEQEVKLAAEDGRDGDFFGQSVDIFNETVVVGALFNDPVLEDQTITNAGAAYIFTPRNGLWRQQAQLIPDDARSFSQFGQSVAIYGNKIVVGANGKAQAGYDDAGATYLYARQGREWQRQTLMVADYIFDNDNFGHSVDISGDKVIVGANGRDPESLRNAGEAFIYRLSQILLPDTGFPPGRITHLPAMPYAKSYRDLGELRMEIPALNVQMPIVGVPESGGGWDVRWLWDQAGYLHGTAFPTWKGNTGIAAHAYLPNGEAGPFKDLKNLAWGDRILIHAWGQAYTYEVREISQVWPDDLSVLQHEDYDWVTLISCETFDDQKGQFQQRLIASAVLIAVEDQ